MFRAKINKQHRPKYRLALFFVVLIVFSVIPMYIFADDGTDIKYVRIKNSWKTAEYLYEQNGKVVYGSPAANDPTSHWVVEDYNGSKRIKNRATSNYINISGHRKKGEADYWNDPVRCSEWKDDSSSFLWTTPVQPEGINITSVLNSTFNIHVEDQNGMAQCSDVPTNWGSPQWLFEPAQATVPEVSANASENASPNVSTNTNTNTNTNVDAPPAPVQAPIPGPKVGGDVAFVFATPLENSSSIDQTFIPWLALNTYINKSLGEHSSAYLKLVTSIGSATPSNLNAVIQFASYGYTYNVNDWLSFAALVDRDGDALADTQVLNDGWNWFHTFNDGDVIMGMRFAPFVQRAEIKMDAAVLPGLNLTLAYGPPTNGSDPSQYLAKFKYSGKGFVISGGYTNTRLGYGGDSDLIPYMPTYAFSGALTAIPNIDLYGEYLDNGYYLVKGNARLNPFTLKVTYGNIGYSRIGNPVYLDNTIDGELDYTISPKLKIISGLSYFVNTAHDGLAIATVGLIMGPLTLAAQHDFNEDPSYISKTTTSLSRVNLATLAPNTTRFTGKYNLEGSSTLEGEFNLETKIYSVMLHVGF